MENTISNIQTSDTTISTPATLPTNTKMVKIVIPDHTGHTTLNQPLDEAIDTIISNVFSKSKTVFLGSTNVFQFTAKNIQDTAALLKDAITLRALLLNEETPVVNLTGDLVGGSPIEDAIDAEVKLRIDAAMKDQNAAILEKIQTAVTAAAAKLNITTAGNQKDTDDTDNESFDISSEDLNDPSELVGTIVELLEQCQDENEIENNCSGGVSITLNGEPTNIVVKLTNDDQDDDDDDDGNDDEGASSN